MDLKLILNHIEPTSPLSPPPEGKPLMHVNASKQPQPATNAPLFHTFALKSFNGSLPSPPEEVINNKSHELQIKQFALNRIFKDKPRKSANQSNRKCISCGEHGTGMWRPAWSGSSGKLCNPCGLRYYRRRIRCTNVACELVPRHLDIVSKLPHDNSMQCPRCHSQLALDKDDGTSEVYRYNTMEMKNAVHILRGIKISTGARN